jgi:hypothetical protein
LSPWIVTSSLMSWSGHSVSNSSLRNIMAWNSYRVPTESFCRLENLLLSRILLQLVKVYYKLTVLKSLEVISH